MEYNSEGLQRLVEDLGIGPRIEYLRTDYGLEDRDLAEALDAALNPSLDTQVPEAQEFFYGGFHPSTMGETRDQIAKRTYRMLANFYGIGTDEKHTKTSAARSVGKSRNWCREKVHNLQRDIRSTTGIKEAVHDGVLEQIMRVLGKRKAKELVKTA